MRDVIRLLYRQRAEFLGMLTVRGDISAVWRQRVRQGIFMERPDVRFAGRDTASVGVASVVVSSGPSPLILAYSRVVNPYVMRLREFRRSV